MTWKNIRSKGLAIALLTVSGLGLLAAAGTKTFRFHGRWEAVLCERLQNRQVLLLDRILENNYDLPFTLLDLATGKQFLHDKVWTGSSVNGFSVSQRQSGGNLNRSGSAVTINVVWELTVNGKKITFPFQYSTDTLSFPAGVPLNLIPSRQANINESQGTADITLGGFKIFEGSVSTEIQNLLRSSGKRDAHWKPHELFTAVVFIGHVTTRK